MFNIKRILVPTDFSLASEAAMDYAVALARTFDARIYVLHVPGETGESFEANFPFSDFLNAGWERFAPFKPEYAMRIGTPAHEIIRYASDRDADVIVMGTHGRTGVPHIVMGSVAEHVVREALCPVLTVRPARTLDKKLEPLAQLTGVDSEFA